MINTKNTNESTISNLGLDPRVGHAKRKKKGGNRTTIMEGTSPKRNSMIPGEDPKDLAPKGWEID